MSGPFSSGIAMSLKVFISHSTEPKSGLSPAAAAEVRKHKDFRIALKNKLHEKHEIDAIVIEDTQPGDFWSHRLMDGLAHCGAAVVLANEQALESSDWVTCEVAVLCQRAHFSRPHFKLLILPIGNVNWHTLSTSAWKFLSILGVQPVQPNGLNMDDPGAVAEALKKIEEALLPLKESTDDRTAIGWNLRKLATFFEDSKPAALQEIATSLAEPACCHARLLAASLYKTGVTAIRCVADSSQYRLKRNDAEEMVDILKTSWVPLPAAIKLFAACNKDSVQRVFSVNGAEINFTPKTYIEKICGSQFTWKTVVVEATKTDEKEILTQIYMDLCAKFNITNHLDVIAPANLCKINEKIERRLNGKPSEPVFVVMMQMSPPLMKQIIPEVLAMFPNIRILLCTGTPARKDEEMRAAQALPTAGPHPIYPLWPEFELAEEQEALKQYEDIMDSIRDMKN